MAKRNKKIHKHRLKENISSRLKAIKDHYGFSREKMAEMMGVSTSAYEANVRGRHVPTIFTLISLDNRLGISIDWLLLGRGPMSRKEEQKREQEAAEERERIAQEMLEQRAAQEQQNKDMFTLEVEEMIEAMKQVPLLRHSVMGHYQQFKIKNAKLLAQHQPQQQTPQPTETPPKNR